MTQWSAESATEYRQAVERSETPAYCVNNKSNPDGVTEILSGLRHFFSCCILSRGSFSAALRKRLLRRRASCYALPLRRQRSSGSPHQARMAIGPSSKGLLHRLPVILPPLLGSSRWLFVAYCSVRHRGLPLHAGGIGFKFLEHFPYALFVISPQGLSLSY